MLATRKCDRWVDRQAGKEPARDRQSVIQTGRQRGEQAEIQTGRHASRELGREASKQRDMQALCEICKEAEK
jgi:hypothetical protein